MPLSAQSNAALCERDLGYGWNRVNIEQRTNHPKKNSKHLFCDLATSLTGNVSLTSTRLGPFYIFHESKREYQ